MHRPDLYSGPNPAYKWKLALTHCPIIELKANSVDPDQTPQNAASDQSLHCLHEFFFFFFCYKYLDAFSVGTGPVQRVDVEVPTENKSTNNIYPH